MRATDPCGPRPDAGHAAGPRDTARQLWALVLAAGASTRMGRAKALLKCPDADDTFVARVVGVCREGGVPDVAVIVRPTDLHIRQELDRLRPPPAVIHNPTPELGQLTSLWCGIDHADASGAEGIVVLPVDMPLVRPASVASLIETAVRRDAFIARVVCRGRHGHPVYFSARAFGRLRAADPAIGARAVLHACAADVVDVPVEDPGVLRDIDRPEEYQQLFDV
jgi:molybdenum cofactor cytidylyltransferase